jgi:cytochrome c biogenesis protein CcmG, thiol:disulfide interchange protein DsbE
MRRVLAAGALAVLLAGCTADPPREGDAGAAPTPTTLAACPEQTADPSADGSALPDLAFDCPGGGELDLARAPGVPTVVNLWGTWCPPCREELPVLQEFADLAGDRVRVVGLISKDGVPQADSFAAEVGLTFPQAFDGQGELMAELGLNALPYTAFLAADGTLVHSEIGPVEDVAEIEALVAEHLGVRL